MTTTYLKLITPDTALAAALLTDIKAHLVIDGTAEDDRLTDLISSALDWISRHTGRDLGQQTWEEVLERFPYNREPIYLKRCPVVSVTSVTYFDNQNESQTWDDENYHVVSGQWVKQGFVMPVITSPYPVAYLRPDAVKVRYVAGYSTIPDVAKHAIRLLCGQWNEARGDVDVPPALQNGLDRLLAQLEVF